MSNIDLMSLIAKDDEANMMSIPIIVSGENPFEVKADNVPDVLPLLPLRNSLLFPGSIMPIIVSRDKSAKLLRNVSESRAFFVVSTQKDSNIEQPTLDDVYQIGTIAKVIKTISLPDGSKSALLHGLERVRINELVTDEPYLTVKATVAPFDAIPENEKKEFTAACSLVKDIMSRIIKGSMNAQPDILFTLANMEPDVTCLNYIAGNCNITPEQKQEVLECNSQLQKAKTLARYMNEELQFIELKNEIQNKTNHAVNRQQREYVLQQQMKAIQSELGNDTEAVVESLRAKGKNKKWNKAVAETFEKEINKLTRLNQNSPEYPLQLDYLETMLALPWQECSKDRFNIPKASKILDQNHFGMEKVKERILEHLAVLKLKGDMKSPILCLYGPPGVGKTSLGRSIAEALGRKYVRISLGGLHDEAEIRGHRRTYIGAMMGRIMQGIKKAGTSNPVFILDEIDKLAHDAHGDPESALLEVLDPEQNSAFHDNYLDIDYDLSKVMFIATANNINAVSQPLLDRMELIDVSGYIAEEKIEIALRHLLPKEMEAHGIPNKTFAIGKKQMAYLIDKYTRESGVRSLDKNIAAICRKVALKLAADEEIPEQLSEADIQQMLGKERVMHDEWENDMPAGVVTGLAWTAVGGEILFIETSASKGKGKLTLTGSLGDVMKESAVIAVEYVRAHAAQFGLSDTNFDETNIHIHVPEGAIPKDGPSAGITMVTSVVSALTHHKAKKRIAMTGEITLRGNVLPVGGIKEKILAAKRAGIKEIILSEVNRKDIDEIKDIYIKGLTFHYVKNIDEVVKIALNSK